MEECAVVLGLYVERSNTRYGKQFGVRRLDVGMPGKPTSVSKAGLAKSDFDMDIMEIPGKTNKHPGKNQQASANAGEIPSQNSI
ncbi:uncharacterized protein N7479_006420 [Penicillium vulpinum]|uniref:uncharacterized protein n=1 Tax=Penicillium vulpinum TaxID=29845 RepID=UPI0025490644|nr:uncharacterized protein N7479_006420 [Penicillium vulpinum]KAJ5959270.1 hypothetical protein N7479_006420 [Penicillium vulpinum]